ncbi:hypothetical protein ACFQ4X_08480 [Fictibacillus halophilus]
METKEFLYQIKPIRSDFMENQSQEDKKVLEAHFFLPSKSFARR